MGMYNNDGSKPKTLGEIFYQDGYRDGLSKAQEMHVEALIKQKRYEGLGRTPEELATDLKDLAAYRAKGQVEELERVVRCGECERFDTINCYGSCSVDFGTGWFTPRMLNGCLNGERREKE